MKKAQENNEKEILNSLFRYYSNNYSECNKAYNLAEECDFEQMYENVIDKEEINTLFTKTAIIVLTANKYERNILHKMVFDNIKTIKRINIDLLAAYEIYSKVYAYWFEIEGYSVLHIHSNVTGSYTIGGSADAIRWIQNNKYLLPSAIVSFGVCFGTQESDCELGNVVISKKVYPYFIGAKLKGEELYVVDDNVFCTDKNLQRELNELQLNNSFKQLGFDALFKNYITGEAIVSSKKWRNKFINITTQEIFAGDMEGYGLFKECNSYNYSIPCVIIKGICDWGINKNIKSNDNETLLALKTELSKNSINISQDELITIIESLKDRIQAIASLNAYKIFNVCLQEKLFQKSIYNSLVEEIKKRTGVAITCRSIKTIIHDLIIEQNFGYTFNECYAHRSILMLEKDNRILCDDKCLDVQNTNDDCINDLLDASFEIKKEDK